MGVGGRCVRVFIFSRSRSCILTIRSCAIDGGDGSPAYTFDGGGDHDENPRNDVGSAISKGVKPKGRTRYNPNDYFEAGNAKVPTAIPPTPQVNGGPDGEAGETAQPVSKKRTYEKGQRGQRGGKKFQKQKKNKLDSKKHTGHVDHDENPRNDVGSAAQPVSKKRKYAKRQRGGKKCQKQRRNKLARTNKKVQCAICFSHGSKGMYHTFSMCPLNRLKGRDLTGVCLICHSHGLGLLNHETTACDHVKRGKNLSQKRIREAKEEQEKMTRSREALILQDNVKELVIKQRVRDECRARTMRDPSEKLLREKTKPQRYRICTADQVSILVKEMPAHMQDANSVSKFIKDYHEMHLRDFSGAISELKAKQQKKQVKRSLTDAQLRTLEQAMPPHMRNDVVKKFLKDYHEQHDIDHSDKISDLQRELQKKKEMCTAGLPNGPVIQRRDVTGDRRLIFKPINDDINNNSFVMPHGFNSSGGWEERHGGSHPHNDRRRPQFHGTGDSRPWVRNNNEYQRWDNRNRNDGSRGRGGSRRDDRHNRTRRSGNRTRNRGASNRDRGHNTRADNRNSPVLTGNKTRDNRGGDDSRGKESDKSGCVEMTSPGGGGCDKPPTDVSNRASEPNHEECDDKPPTDESSRSASNSPAYSPFNAQDLESAKSC